MKTFLLQLSTALLLFFAPIQQLVIVVGLAILCDTFTGIYKSVKLDGWKSIRSRKLSNIISKMVLYEVAIIVLYPIDKFLLNELLLNIVSVQFFSTKVACVLLILVELTSIKENIEEALKIDIWKTLKNFIKRAKEVSNNYDEIKN
jgi:phage-related holin